MTQVEQFREHARASLGSLQHDALIKECETLLAQANGDEALTAAVHIALFETYYDLSQYDKAVSYIKQAVEIAERSGDNSLLADALTNEAAYAVHVKGNYPEARKKLALAIAAAINADDLVQEARARSVQANLYGHEGNFAKLLSEQKNALKLADASGDALTIATVLNNIGNYYIAVRNPSMARGFYEQALTRIEHTPNKPTEGIIRAGLALSYLYSKTPDAFSMASEQAEQALQVAREGRSPTQLVAALQLMGRIHQMKSDFEQSNAYYQQALEQATLNGDDNFQRAILADRGNLLIDNKAYDDARATFERLLSITDVDVMGFIHAHVHLAHLAYLRGEGRQAMHHYGQAWRGSSGKPFSFKLYVILAFVSRTPPFLMNRLLRRV